MSLAVKADDIAIELYGLADDGTIPNNAALPLIVYRGALPPSGDSAGQFETLFARHGWSGGWRSGIFAYHHYHSTAHEVLGIASRQARVRFGGEPGESVEVRQGDVVIVS